MVASVELLVSVLDQLVVSVVPVLAVVSLLTSSVVDSGVAVVLSVLQVASELMEVSVVLVLATVLS